MNDEYFDVLGYIEDNYNYYPQLRDNNLYWKEVSDDEYYIKSNAVI